MANLGMHFNYEKKYQRNWLYCTLPIIIAFALLLISFAADIDYTYNDYTVFIQRSMIHVSSITFIILLHSLYERFALINSHLRYYWFHFIIITIFHNI